MTDDFFQSPRNKPDKGLGMPEFFEIVQGGSRSHTDWKLPYNPDVSLTALAEKVHAYLSKGTLSKACIISGAPSAGKTSVVNELEKRGLPILNEAATEIIESDERLGINYQNVNLQQRFMRIDLLKVMKEFDVRPDQFV